MGKKKGENKNGKIGKDPFEKKGELIDSLFNGSGTRLELGEMIMEWRDFGVQIKGILEELESFRKGFLEREERLERRERILEQRQNDVVRMEASFSRYIPIIEEIIERGYSHEEIINQLNGEKVIMDPGDEAELAERMWEMEREMERATKRKDEIEAAGKEIKDKEKDIKKREKKIKKARKEIERREEFLNGVENKLADRLKAIKEQEHALLNMSDPAQYVDRRLRFLMLEVNRIEEQIEREETARKRKEAGFKKREKDLMRFEKYLFQRDVLLKEKERILEEREMEIEAGGEKEEKADDEDVPELEEFEGVGSRFEDPGKDRMEGSEEGYNKDIPKEENLEGVEDMKRSIDEMTEEDMMEGLDPIEE